MAFTSKLDIPIIITLGRWILFLSFLFPKQQVFHLFGLNHLPRSEILSPFSFLIEKTLSYFSQLCNCIIREVANQKSNSCDQGEGFDRLAIYNMEHP